MAMSPGLLLPRSEATAQHNSLGDDTDLVKFEETLLLKKRSLNENGSANYTNAGSIKISKEHVINTLRAMKGEVAIHKEKYIHKW